MTHGLLAPLQGSKILENLIQTYTTKPAMAWATQVVESQKWHLTAALLQSTNRPALVIASSELKAKAIYEDLYYFFKDTCSIYPSRDMLFYAADVKSVDITRQRLRVLDKLNDINQNPIIILSAEAMLDRMTPPAIFRANKLELSVGDIAEPEAIIRKLATMGYERSGLVEGPGQFALRGGILDIYPAVAKFTPPAPKSKGENYADEILRPIDLLEGQALRLEFFGDDIDSIRVVDALSQRSIENAESFELYPVREMVFDKATLRTAIKKIEQSYKTQHEALLSQGLKKEAANLKDTIEQILDRLDLSTNADALFPFFYEEDCNLLDYLQSNTLIIFDEPNHIATHMEVAGAEYQDSISHRLMAGRLLPEQALVMLSWQQALHKTESFSRLLLSSMTQVLMEFDPAPTPIPIPARSCQPLRHKPSELKKDLETLLTQGYRIVILAGPRRHGQQLADAITDMGLLARYTDNLAGANIPPNLITITRGALSAGFEYTDLKLAVITDKELFAQEKKVRRKHRRDKNAEKINHFTDLRIGDKIVHDNHGIGIFKGIEQITSEGLSRDYLKLEYSDGGNLYVQTSQMDLIQRYIGGESAKLSKLGGADWAKAKAKARQAVEILAQDLINLYAKRLSIKAHEYGPDTVWQSEFEGMFPYSETDDQLAAIEDVKKDMESTKVMDRLLCGDVGYGKTEVAIRAAFKAVQDNKQVAYLVPTTILAQQHYQTFASRMRDYPVSVERLSRFQSKKEQQTALKELEKGSVDIIIGTHRLLSKDVKFKDLGLIIVDEEQRFGVGHKEKLKELRSDVDVLTLTATPIPRTLHFSLTGIRDMSILDEPPEARQPIQTYVMEHNPEFVRDAINRELGRGGQVYYLHNRVKNIAEEATKVQNLVPQARVAFAHGQMSETELENIMHDFVDGEIDVLVCTTIIETGLDIPNTNTIIIQNADYMGLSQLYQLRGRVGRSNRLAYAYLMYRRDKILKEEAEKRLQTIREFTEFGAGFKIAMRDLEIRGAGNLLGAQQHGHMDTVGYDMYCKLLAEAVGQLKGTPGDETQTQLFETTIDISIDAFIPDRLIPHEQQKLEIYKKISTINNQQDYYDVQEEIEDRYGNIPPSVVNLMDVALTKAKARSLGVIAIAEKEVHTGKNIIITFRPDASVDPDKLAKTLNKAPNRLLFTMAPNPYITMRFFKEEKPAKDGGVGRLMDIKKLLERLG
ncbi:MAG: transcription-repair coupling factor [Defluviitaleaceae bacterium]|nr:transcription-repair coupling factor [Defluviitaleaceae bacterium]